MVLTGALLDIKMGREWRWNMDSKEEEYLTGEEKFKEFKSALKK